MKIFVLLKIINKKIRIVYDYFNDFVSNNNDNITINFINFWSQDRNVFKNIWFYNYLEYKLDRKLIISNFKTDIEFYSIFGNKNKITKSKAPVKIFYTGECVNSETIKYNNRYNDHCLEYSDLSLGFQYLDKHNYLRFPIWILYFFNYDSTKDDIKKIVDDFNNHQYKKNKFCSLVSLHDKNGIRTDIYKSLSKIETVSSAGKLLKNDDSLKNDFNDDKCEYLKDFKFNICPENTNSNGYVTEKIFQAFYSGCIPIYWGNRNPEPEVINKEAFFFWEKDNDNFELLKEINFLNSSEKACNSFLKKKRLLDSSVDYIWKIYTDLNEHIEQILANNKLNKEYKVG